MDQVHVIDIPNELDDCVDVDAHEMIPVHMWGKEFGAGGQRVLELFKNTERLGDSAENTLIRDDITADGEAITTDSVWTIRGPSAPSAIDLLRREEVMDVMGIRKQLVFPTFALCGITIANNSDAHNYFGYDPDVIDRIALSRLIIDSHNDWCVRTMEKTPGERIRPVGVILTESLPDMLADAERLIAQGIRCVQISGGMPPGDMSPGDERLDPFWKMFADANVPVTIHIGTEPSLLASTKWGEGVPQFVSAHNSSLEFPIQPFAASILNIPSEIFLTAMVLGGVFERHPTLRFGIIEIGAQWIGPLAERLDQWAGEFKGRLKDYLSMKPSEYINRNVRVTPFVFEQVGTYFDRYPQLSDVYCFSSDYPHREGGKWSKKAFNERLADHSAEVRQKFFVDNGAWLMPD